MNNKDFRILLISSNINTQITAHLPHGPASLSAFLKQYGFQVKIIHEQKERKLLVYQILDILGCSYSNDQAGMFVWARIPKTYDSGDDFSDWLLQKYRIFVTPGLVFGKNGKHYIRVSLCKDVEILKQIKEQLK